MRDGVADDGLVVPLLAATPEDDVAEITRDHLRRAGITRPALFVDTATTVQANFRTWRDTGITWLAMTGLGVDKIQRRAGHESIATTLG
jgi:integrase